MAGIIKGQILKHLSKFTKNLGADKINVSTLKGEGELTGLELDEEVLMELLDLPTWLAVTKAVCNRVAIKIQWTKLKSQPICLYLDEIELTMETCETPRKFGSSSPISSYSTGGKYGFAERIIDGMYVSINSVVVNFKAKAFAASIQMSRIIIQSKSPTWQNIDLRMTRIKDDNRGEIIIFKEAEYQTLRIEANALEGAHPHLATTPLRLIANQSKIRISIKKRLIDCGIVSSRLQVNLDDLLWVLTDSQMKAALGFVNSLRDVIKKSNQQSKKLAAEKLRKQGHLVSPVHTPHQQQQQQQRYPPQQQTHRHPSSQQQQQQQQQQQRNMSRSENAISQLFTKYDIHETSYHLYTSRIDLHLCDDSAPGDEDYKRRVEGGAMQLTFHKLCFDYYPFHPAGGDRTHWLRYDENMAARDIWTKDLLDAFKEDVRKVREIFSPTKPPPELSGELEPPDPSLTRQSQGHGQSQRVPGSQGQGQRVAPGPAQGQRHSASTQSPHRSSPHHSARPTKLLENSVIVRLEDFFLYRVSTARDHKRNAPKKFLSSDKKQLLLPPEMSSVHIEYTDYYFPDGQEHPIPNANIYVMVNPVRLVLDYLTVVWLNAFALNLLKRAEIPVDDGGPKVHVDMKMEALMPRIILPADEEVQGQSDRPEGLQLQMSRMIMTNTHKENKSSLRELSTLLDRLDKSRLFHTNEFPNAQDQLIPVPNTYRSHAEQTDSPYLNKAVGNALIGRGVPNGDLPPESCGEFTPVDMKLDALRLDATKDLWCIAVDQFWMEFIGVPSSKNRPVPFMESFPVTLWLARPLVALGHDPSSDQSKSDEKTSDAPEHKLNGDKSDSISGCESDRLEKAPKSQLADPVNCLLDGDLGDLIVGQENGLVSSSHNTLVLPNDKKATDTSKLADLHILLQIGSRVSLQLNHFQYLFLMRLIETILKYQGEIEEDTEFILKALKPASKKIAVTYVVDELELALVCPPLRELPSLQHNHAEDESTDDKDQDDIPDEAAKEIPMDVDNGDTVKGDEKGENGTITGEGFDDDDSSGTIPTSISKSQSDTDIMSTPTSSPEDLSPQDTVTEPPSLKEVYSEPHTLNLAGESSPRIFITDGGSVTASMGSASPNRQSPLRQLQHSQVHQAQTREQNRKSTELKKSFNSAFSSLTKLTEKVKHVAKRDLLDINDDSGGLFEDLETMSMKSGSSEEDFLILKFQNESEMPAFLSQKPMDDASTTDAGSDLPEEAESTSTSFTTSSGLDRPKGMVSVVSFRILNIEGIVQMVGTDTAVSAQLDHFIPVEYGNVNLDRFQAKFASGERSEEKLPIVTAPPVQFRFQLGPKAKSFSPRAVEQGYIWLKAVDLSTRMKMSSLTNFTDLIEDERLPEPLPMLIEITDSSIILKDDKPPTYMTSPGTVPLELQISNAVVRRTDDGVFKITANSSDAWRRPSYPLSPSAAMSASMTQTDDEDGLETHTGEKRRKELESLEKENDQYRRQLEKIGKMTASRTAHTIESLMKDNETLREESMRADVLQQENKEMLDQLKRQNKELLTVKQERESLLHTIQQLQEELQASESMRNHHPPHT